MARPQRKRLGDLFGGKLKERASEIIDIAQDHLEQQSQAGHLPSELRVKATRKKEMLDMLEGFLENAGKAKVPTRGQVPTFNPKEEDDILDNAVRVLHEEDEAVTVDVEDIDDDMDDDDFSVSWEERAAQVQERYKGMLQKMRARHKEIRQEMRREHLTREKKFTNGLEKRLELAKARWEKMRDQQKMKTQDGWKDVAEQRAKLKQRGKVRVRNKYSRN